MVVGGVAGLGSNVHSPQLPTLPASSVELLATSPMTATIMQCIVPAIKAIFLVVLVVLVVVSVVGLVDHSTMCNRTTLLCHLQLHRNGRPVGLRIPAAYSVTSVVCTI